MEADRREEAGTSAGRLMVAIVAAVVVEAIAFYLAIASAGLGHGDYLYAWLFFPGEMLLGSWQRGLSGLPICIAFIHYPALIIPFAWVRSWQTALWPVVAIFVCHAIPLLVFGCLFFTR